MAGQSLHELVLEVGYSNLPKATKELEKALGEASKLNLDVTNLDEVRKHIEKILGKGLEKAIQEALDKGTKKVDWKKALGSFSDSMGSALQKGFAAIKDPLQMGDAIKSLSGAMKKFESFSKNIKGLGALGKLAGSFAPLVGSLGSIVGLLSKVVQIVLQVDKQAKDLNKTLISGGVTAQDMGAGLGEVSKELEIARDAALDFSNNLKWGTVAKEQLEILKTFNEAGILMKNMEKYVGGAESKMEAYQKATASALTYSKLFGISTQEIAKTQAQFMEEQGMDMKAMEQRFSAIYKAADMAGFGTKRFYSMVLNATSGMSMYNVRMEEAASLMVSLSKALDPSKASAFLQTLTKGYTESSYQDRVKKILITGSKTTQKIMSANADRVARDFSNKFTDELGPGGGMSDALKKAGIGDIAIGLTDDKSRKDAIEKLGQMSEGEIAAITASLKETDPSGVMTREFGKLYDASKGTTGKLGDMAKAMDDLGPGGTLAMKLAEGNALLGPIHERSLVQLMATESMQGLSGEQLKQMQAISRDMHGSYENLQSVASSGEFQKLSAEEQAKKSDELLKAYGATVKSIDGQTKIVDSQGKPIEDFTAFIMANSDRFGELTAEAVDENTALAQEIAQNTTELSKIIEMGVQYWLEQIYKLVAPLVSKILGAADPRKVAELTEKAQNKIAEAQKEMVDLQKQESALNTKIKSEEDPEKRQKMIDELAGIKEKISSQQKVLSIQREKLGKAQMAGVGAISLGEAEQMTPEELVNAVKATEGEEKAAAFEAQLNNRLDTMVQNFEKAGDIVLTSEEEQAARRAAVTAIGTGLESGMSLEDAMDRATQHIFGAGATGGVDVGAGAIIKDMVGLGGSRTENILGQATEATAASGETRKEKIAGERSKEQFVSEVGWMGQKEAMEQFRNIYGEEGLKVFSEALTDSDKEMIKAADDQWRKQQNFDEDLAEKQAKDIAKLTVEEEEKQKIKSALNALYGMGNVPKSLMDAIEENPADALKTIKSSQAYQSNAPLLQQLYPEVFGLGAGGGGSWLPGGMGHDFISRPGESPMKFNPGDTIVGMKPGGPIEKGGGGGAKNVTINVNGGDPQAVYKVVKKALMDSGMAP